MTLLAHLVSVSERVAANSARLSKVRALADFLRSLPPEDVETAVLYLAGETPQGRIGIGFVSLQAAAGASATAVTAASTETLAIGDIDRALTVIAAIRGSGSASRRDQALGALFSRATPREQRFLIQLLAGELRQGALTGVMLDAIADASRLPALEITTRSPAATCSSSRDRCVLASWMFTVVMPPIIGLDLV